MPFLTLEKVKIQSSSVFHSVFIVYSNLILPHTTHPLYVYPSPIPTTVLGLPTPAGLSTSAGACRKLSSWCTGRLCSCKVLYGYFVTVCTGEINVLPGLLFIWIEPFSFASDLYLCFCDGLLLYSFMLMIFYHGLCIYCPFFISRKLSWESRLVGKRQIRVVAVKSWYGQLYCIQYL